MRPGIKSLWFASSLVLFLACSWFIVMELLLRHPGYRMRSIIGLLIAYYALLGLRCASANSYAVPVLASLVICALATLTVSLLVLRADLRSTHFEGHVLLLALILIAQSLLTLANTIARPRFRLA